VPPPGPAAWFAVSGPATVSAGTPASVTVTAMDAVGQAATGYAGTAAVASSDGRAVLPAALTFSAGVATGSIELRTAGSQTLTVSDQGDPTVTGNGALTVTAAAPTALAFAAPPAATAGAPFSPAVAVQIEDAYGNRTTATDAVTLALGANPGSDTLAGTLTRNAVGGMATFPDLVLQRAAAGYTLTASAAGRTGATSATFTVAPGAAASLDFVQQAGTTVAGDPFTPAPAVAIRDAYGNLTHSTAAVSLTLGGGTPGAALLGTATASAVDGTATFPGLSVDLVGQGYRLLASSAGLTGATGAGFGVTPASADHLVFLQGPADLVAGDGFAPAPSVAALDRFGNLATGFVGNVTLGLAVNPSGASLVGLTTATAVGGLATFPGLTLERAGVGYALSASSGPLGGATSSPFRVSPGAVTQVLFGTEPGASTAGAPIAGPPAVHLADAYGNRQPAATDPVNLSIAANPGGDTLTGTTTVDAVAGVATFSDLVLRKAAAGYRLLASSGAATPGTSAAFTVGAGTATALELVAAPASAAAGAPLTPAPAFRVVDAFGNTTTSPPVAVTVALGANPSAGTLSGATAAATAAGAVSFPGLTIDRAGAGYTLTASAAGLGPATTAAFDVAAGPPAALVFLSQPASVQAGAPIGPLTLELRDAHGNRTAATDELLVGIATAPASATLGGTRRVSAAAGRAVFSDLTLDRAGTGYTLSATAAGLPPAVTGAFDVTAAAAARLSITALPASLEADAATTIGLVAHDPYGNVATGYAGTARFTSTDPQATLPASATFAAGTASGLRIRLHTPGTQTVTVTDAGDPALRGEASAVVVGPAAAPPPQGKSGGGCGCGAGDPGELGLLLALGALWRAAVVPRRRGRG
jgi:hypothetical protein